MIDGLKPYPAMKDSGVEWLGQVPEHWNVERADHHLSVTKKAVNLVDLPEQKVVHYSIPNVQQHGKGLVETSSSIESSKTVVDREILLVSKLNPRMGTVVLADRHPQLMTVASGEFVVMDPRKSVGKFMKYVYASEGVRLELSSRVESATKSHQRCSPADISKLPIPFPPLAEQSTIVRFLDHADQRIQRYIRAKEKLIALLEEQKQAIVHQAVTGRIDVRTGRPYPAYKDSGVEWLGRVPEHWDVRRLGQFGAFSKGAGGSKEDEQAEGVPCVRYGDLYTTHKFFIEQSRAYVSDARAVHYAPLQFGDVLFAASGETIGEIGKSAVNLMEGPARCGGDVILFRPKRKVEPRYLGYAAGSPSAIAQKAMMGRGFTVAHIYGQQLKRLAVALAPSEEQVTVVRFLDRVLGQMDASMLGAQQQISLIREYRTSLVAAAVTGKIDVRDAARMFSSVEECTRDAGALVAAVASA